MYEHKYTQRKAVIQLDLFNAQYSINSYSQHVLNSQYLAA